jgi:hypothetical protein
MHHMNAAECRGGPLIAGRFDSSCVQGGLGLFQFDAGTFEDAGRRVDPDPPHRSVAAARLDGRRASLSRNELKGGPRA